LLILDRIESITQIYRYWDPQNIVDLG